MRYIQGFVRSLDDVSKEKLTKGKNGELFALLQADIAAGCVFPAVRKNELYFYYLGGCLYKFARCYFTRDKNWEKFGVNTDGLFVYDKAKNEVEHKFAKMHGGSAERWLLNKLYCHTFNTELKSKVVVLDIEVNLKGAIGGGKKCDLVLLNTETNEIMFVEGKVFADPRVKCKVGRTPEVIEQVNIYTAAMEEQRQVIIEQYGEYVRIINDLFGTSYNPPKKLIEPAKLLVYETDFSNLTVNGSYSIETINQSLGTDNVMWVETYNEPTIEEIWTALSGGVCK